MKKTVIVCIASIVVLCMLFVANMIYINRAPELTYTYVALNGVVLACSNYFQIYGEWPTSIQDFEIDSHRNPKHDVFLTYARTSLLARSDGWLHPLVFKQYDPSLGYGSVISYGRDGRIGGTGLDADIEVRFGEKTKKSF